MKVCMALGSLSSARKILASISLFQRKKSVLQETEKMFRFDDEPFSLFLALCL